MSPEQVDQTKKERKLRKKLEKRQRKLEKKLRKLRKKVKKKQRKLEKKLRTVEKKLRELEERHEKTAPKAKRKAAKRVVTKPTKKMRAPRGSSRPSPVALVPAATAGLALKPAAVGDRGARERDTVGVTQRPGPTAAP